MKNIVITGAAGFIASCLAKEIERRYNAHLIFG
jgi:nucleoside-diphosphate-sugar epimerase